MVASPDYDADAARVFECLQDGGIAIVHMDVAYAIMSGTEAVSYTHLTLPTKRIV